MAKEQRLLFNRKKQEAYMDAQALVARKYRRYCFVADYAQNAYVPNFAGEQPGETYYYSPLNAYVFGIVNSATRPAKLTASIYFEGEAKKGANNVASMLLKNLYDEGLVAYSSHQKRVKELNFVFDNCGGQNKNRVVLRLIMWMVEIGITETARAIFLVRGHTHQERL